KKKPEDHSSPGSQFQLQKTSNQSAFIRVHPRPFSCPLVSFVANLSGGGGHFTAPATDSFSSLISVTSTSVVKSNPATDAAFCSAERVTFAGSTMPSLNISPYSPLAAL